MRSGAGQASRGSSAGGRIEIDIGGIPRRFEIASQAGEIRQGGVIAHLSFVKRNAQPKHSAASLPSFSLAERRSTGYRDRRGHSVSQQATLHSGLDANPDRSTSCRLCASPSRCIRFASNAASIDKGSTARSSYSITATSVRAPLVVMQGRASMGFERSQR